MTNTLKEAMALHRGLATSYEEGYLKAQARVAELEKIVHDAEVDAACIAQELHDWRGDPAHRCEEAANDIATICERLRAALKGENAG